MKIVISGSSKFRKEKVKIFNELKAIGQEPIIDDISKRMVEGDANELIQQEESEPAEIKKKYNFIRLYHNLIESSEAILICNYDKNGIKNYIGANSFLEMGDAHVLRKKIFLFNDIPDQGYIQDEIDAIEPIVINGDLSKIE